MRLAVVNLLCCLLSAIIEELGCPQRQRFNVLPYNSFFLHQCCSHAQISMYMDTITHTNATGRVPRAMPCNLIHAQLDTIQLVANVCVAFNRLRVILIIFVVTLHSWITVTNSMAYTRVPQRKHNAQVIAPTLTHVYICVSVRAPTNKRTVTSW